MKTILSYGISKLVIFNPLTSRPIGKTYRLSDCYGIYIQVNPSDRSFLCCGLRVILIDCENRCKEVFAKTTNLISLVNDIFRHNPMMISAGKTGCNIE